MSYEVHHGDCLEVMKSLPDNSVDAVVTDPPYGLSFMGKKWDYDVPSVEIWQEVLRVLKPGGHLLSFGGTRTYHRMVVNIEDAGFEIRDQIQWIYGSGFPKSLDVSKAMDKQAGAEREVVGQSKAGFTTGYSDAMQMETGYRPKRYYEDADGTFDITAPATESAKQWEGWGTALKPANEPICLARKPLIGTVAENVMEYGTGAINIDGSRVEIPENDKENYEFNNNGLSRMSRPEGDKLGQFDGGWKIDKTKRETPLGRFPANLIHDGSDEVVSLFPDTKSGGGNKGNVKNGTGMFGNGKAFDTDYVEPNSGSAARFFYCAKASKADRNAGLEGVASDAKLQFTAKGGLKCLNCDKWKSSGNPCLCVTPNFEQQQWKGEANKNNHPTVKPTELMRYLCRLITPPNGTVLDPFAGSGSTGKAAILEGFSFIGIEREREYAEIARARIAHVSGGLFV